MFSSIHLLSQLVGMKRVLIFGNSGSGKSTLAKAFKELLGCIYLDLDTVAWKQDQPGVREEEEVSLKMLDEFSRSSDQWIAEGCYSGLIRHLTPKATELIFLNPGVETCVANCQSRPWEPHKYASKDEQDERLAFLIDWVRDYETRTDEFSLEAHRKLFDLFEGNKRELVSNPDAEAFRSSIRNLD